MSNRDFEFLDWNFVVVEYGTRHTKKVLDFKPKSDYHVLPVMDCSDVGMHFRYFFKDEQDLIAFKEALKDVQI